MFMDLYVFVLIIMGPPQEVSLKIRLHLAEIFRKRKLDLHDREGGIREGGEESYFVMVS